MRFNKQKTTDWKRENGLRIINFCIPIDLLQEFDWYTTVKGSTRSERIRTLMRRDIKESKETIADEERKALEAYHAKQQNQKRQVNTGLLPDY